MAVSRYIRDRALSVFLERLPSAIGPSKAPRGSKPSHLTSSADLPALAGEMLLLLQRLERAVFDGRSGLPRGDRALAALVTARRIGSLTAAAIYASNAILHLRSARDVIIVLEEGIPSPVTGRRGTLVHGAAALSSTPVLSELKTLHRLDSDGFDEADHLDLILATAVSVWTSRVALASGGRERGPKDAPDSLQPE